MLYLHSTSAYSRRLIHEYELYYRDARGKIIPGAFKFNVIVTTYEVMLCECVCVSVVCVWCGGVGVYGCVGVLCVCVVCGCVYCVCDVCDVYGCVHGWVWGVWVQR